MREMFTKLRNIVQYIAAIAKKPTTLVLKDLVLSLAYRRVFGISDWNCKKTTSFNEDFNGRQVYEIYNT